MGVYKCNSELRNQRECRGVNVAVDALLLGGVGLWEYLMCFFWDDKLYKC